jgi:hypothetical protein
VGFNLLLTRNKLDHLGGIEIEPEDDCNGKFVLATDYIGGKTGSYIEGDPTRVDFCMGMLQRFARYQLLIRFCASVPFDRV